MLWIPSRFSQAMQSTADGPLATRLREVLVILDRSERRDDIIIEDLE